MVTCHQQAGREISSGKVDGRSRPSVHHKAVKPNQQTFGTSSRSALLNGGSTSQRLVRLAARAASKRGSQSDGSHSRTYGATRSTTVGHNGLERQHPAVVVAGRQQHTAANHSGAVHESKKRNGKRSGTHHHQVQRKKQQVLERRWMKRAAMVEAIWKINNDGAQAYNAGNFELAFSLFRRATSAPYTDTKTSKSNDASCEMDVSDGNSGTLGSVGVNVIDTAEVGRNIRKVLRLLAICSQDCGEQDEQMAEECGKSAVPLNIGLEETEAEEPVPPTTSDVHQRMEFDEGMNGYGEAETITPAMIYSLTKKPASPNLPGGGTDLENLQCFLAIILYNAGQSRRRMGAYAEAEVFYGVASKVLGLWSDALKLSHPIVVALLHNVGQLQYRLGKLDHAVRTFEKAHAQAGRIYGAGHLAVATALNALGVLYYHKSADESERALNFFQESLRIRIASLGRDHADVATTLNNIGRIFVQREKYEEALKFYDDAMRIRALSLGTNHLDYAASAFNAGQSHHQRGDLDRALAMYEIFLVVASDKLGKDHRDVAVVLSGMAQIHQERDEGDKAKELYERSLQAGRASLGEYHPEVAMLLNRIGNFHFEREDLDSALRAYDDGLRIERRVLEPDHPNITVTLCNLGEIHRQKGNLDDAVRLYKEALDMQRSRSDSNSPNAEVASTLNTLGLIQDQRGDTCQALVCLQEALIMRRAALGNSHLDVSATLTYLGTIFYKKNMLAVALDLFTESLRIRREALGAMHRDVAYITYNMGLVHQQRGCYEEAVDYYKETLRVESHVLGSDHRDVAMTHYKLGETYKAQGDFEKALHHYCDALRVERLTVGHIDPAAVARTLNEIGNIHLARGEASPMMEAFNEAARLYRNAGLSPNNLVVSGQLYAFSEACPAAAAAA